MDRHSERGFTLVELMTVVTIIGVLLTIAVPVYRVATDRATNAVLGENAHLVETKVRLLLMDDYDLRFRAGRRADPDVYLCARLAEDLASGDVGTTDATLHPIENPVSKNDNVIMAWSANQRNQATPPGVFITRARQYGYDRIRANPGRLAGTIIVYFNNQQDTIDVFYMDENGVKSDEVARIDAGGDVR